MYRQICFYTLLLLSLTQLPAQACPPGDPNSTEYIRRDNPERCEGIQRQPVSGNSLELVSFTSRNIGEYGNSLTLRVPRLNGSDTPEFILQSRFKNYSLDQPNLTIQGSQFALTWNTYVLRNEEIPPKSLRALAVYNIDSEPIYAPVILGEPSGQYEFTFFTPSRAKFRLWEIKRNGKTVTKRSYNSFRSGEINFTWDGSNAPAGRYELHYIADIQPKGEPTEPINRSIFFDHNPNWLQ